MIVIGLRDAVLCCAVAGSPHEPGRVLGQLEHKAVVAVAAGREHALAATADGQLYSFGGGRAVLGRAGDAGSPELVAGALAGQFVRHVAAGEVRHAVFGEGSRVLGGSMQ